MGAARRDWDSSDNLGVVRGEARSPLTRKNFKERSGKEWAGREGPSMEGKERAPFMERKGKDG